MTTSESTSTELLHAQAQIWNYIFDFISSSAVRCALQLGILDVLYKHGKPMCLDDLSTELSVINPSKISLLSILMRFSVQSGFLNQHEDHFSLTLASRLLAKNEPFNLRSILLLNHDPVLSKAWSELGAWFQNDSPTAFHTTHGKSFWDYIGKEQHKVLSDTFNDALASDLRLNTNVLITECKHVFEGLTSLA
ncbi:putative tabersonine 16-O-methyltransferase [Capsicum annuum]|nr:putative tabersonine 16-O-methyltransferase [Capsicum annuum]